MADAPPHAYVVKGEGPQGLPDRRAWWMPHGQTLQAEKNTVIRDEAPCENRAAAHLQKPARLAQHRGA